MPGVGESEKSSTWSISAPFVTGDALRGKSLPDGEGELCEVGNFSLSQWKAKATDEEEPVTTPGDVTDDATMARHVDSDGGFAAVAGDVLNDDRAVGAQLRCDDADRGFDEMAAGVNALEKGEGRNHADGSVATHAEHSNIVEVENAGCTCGVAGRE